MTGTGGRQYNRQGAVREKSLCSHMFQVLPGVISTCLLLAILHWLPLPAHAAEQVRVAAFSAKPLIFIDSDNRARGISVDLINRIAEENDWDVEYIAGSWDSGLQRAKTKQVDLITSAMFTEERDRFLDYAAEPYFTVWSAVYAAADTPLKTILDLNDKTVAIMKGDQNGRNFKLLADKFGLTCKYLELPTFQDVFEATQQGKAAAGVAVNIYGMLQSGRYQLVQTPIIFNPEAIYFAVPQGTKAELLQTISRTLRNWKTDKNSHYYRTLNTWLATGGHSKPTLPSWIYAVLGALVGLIGLTYFWTLTLKRKVAQRTEQITEQAKLLQESEAKLRILFDEAPGAIFIINRHNGRYIDANKEAEKLTGRTLTELKKLTTKDVTPEGHKNRIKALQKPQSSFEFGEIQYQRPDGKIRTAQLTAIPINDELSYGLASDITERKKIEEELRESETKFRAAFTTSPDAITLNRARDGVCLDVNEGFLRLSGYAASDVLGKPYPEWDIWIHREERDQFIRTLQDKGCVENYEAEFKTKGGKVIHGLTSAQTIELEGRTIILTITRDITERKKAEKQLIRNEQKYRTLLDSQHDAIFLHKLNTEGFSAFVEVNQVAIDRYGYSREEFRRIGPPDITLTRDAERHAKKDFRKRLLEEKHLVFETRHIKKSGEVFPVEISGTITELDDVPYILSIARDITERKQAENERREFEEQLRQKYKMEAIGVMAGGIAHNFNNTLAAILGSLEMAKRKQGQPQKLQTYLDTATTAALRSRDLVAQVLTYSRQSENRHVATDITLVIEETLNLLKLTLPTTTTLEFEDRLRSKTLIEADPNQIQEALLNLCNNAVHAMEENGTLLVRTESVELAKSDIPAQFNRPAGPYICLAVQDNGSGMSEEVVEKIFDPFFTTKGVDEGTGMGLSTVQGIIDKHAGLIKVDSRVGEGTTFRLYFPATNKAIKLEEHAIEEAPPSGNERILLVDDDKTLVELGAEMLSDLGYRVTGLTSGQDALQLLTAESEAFDLVITDQTMPELTGKELILQLRKTNPDIRTVIMTGYSSKIDAEEAKEIGINAFCMKPLNMSELAQTVRRALD